MSANLGTLILTGGGRGIGAAIARLAARHGYAGAVNYVANEDAAYRSGA
jgi:NAD(P)-dependent dehydrogenase (short-subunit alcohol dehydrogenase family)